MGNLQEGCGVLARRVRIAKWRWLVKGNGPNLLFGGEESLIQNRLFIPVSFFTICPDRFTFPFWIVSYVDWPLDHEQALCGLPISPKRLASKTCFAYLPSWHGHARYTFHTSVPAQPSSSSFISIPPNHPSKKPNINENRPHSRKE